MLKLYALLMLLTVAEGFSASATAQVGQSVELTVTAEGTPPLIFGWTRNGVAIPGATSATLLLSPVAKADAGEYSATVSNAAGSANSDKATLTIAPMLATLTANVTSLNYPGPAIYTWRLNGQTIKGASGPVYQFDPVTVDGSVSLTVTYPKVSPSK